MTAGYDPNFGPGGRAPGGMDGRPDPDETIDRAGPTPASSEATWGAPPPPPASPVSGSAPVPGSTAASWAPAVSPGSPVAPGSPVSPGWAVPAGSPVAAGSPGWAVPAGSPGSPVAAGSPGSPVAGSAYQPYPQTAMQPPIAAQASTPPGYGPSTGHPVPYTPTGAPPGGDVAAPAWPPAPGVLPVPRRRLAWPGVLALVLVLGLVGVVVFQARQIDRLAGDLDRADGRLTQEQAADDARLDGLDDRAAALEKAAGQVFNPEAIASAVLPSVFRVAAGDFTGTAFAVGKPAGGGTNLFTNFHVVESVWESGGREVQIERRGESYPARIAKVDEENDVAQLTTDQRFDGLVMASAAVKSGQQIVVVGAPLGLEDTVTTGVVSAFRKEENGNGSVIQFSAPINPGNSGGPVINGEKQVVGIATAKAADAEGIGLAVPIKTACDEFKIC